MTIAPQPEPLYVVYEAGTSSCVCYRVVTAQPAPPADFLSHIDLAEKFSWWRLHRAAGVSAWLDIERAVALARRKAKYTHIATIDLARADPKVTWAETGAAKHVTIWAPAPIILKAVVSYADIR